MRTIIGAFCLAAGTVTPITLVTLLITIAMAPDASVSDILVVALLVAAIGLLAGGARLVSSRPER